MPTEKLLSTDIGFVVEVTGEKTLVELTVDTTQPLDGGYYPGQPGSYVKIPFREQSVIATVSGVRVTHAASGDRKIADCLLLGTLNRKGRFQRGVAEYPNVGQKAKMVTAQELREIFSEFVDFGFAFGAPVQAEDQRAYVHVDRFFGRHTAILGTTGCGKSCTVASILQNLVRKYPQTHVVVLDLHGEYAAALPEHVMHVEADKVELPYWLMDFDEFVDLTIDFNEPEAKNQISVLRDALLRARQSTDRRESLGLGGAVTVDSPIYFSLDDMLGHIRGYNIQMVQGPTGRLEQGPLFGVFDRFMIRFESKMSDPRFAFMFNPPCCKDNKSLPDLLKQYLSIDTGKQMVVVDLSGIPSEAVGVVVAVVSRIVFEFNLWNPYRHDFPILLVYEEAHNYIPQRSDSKFTATKIAVERVAKEGRKYGVGMIVVSQRPKELSETVIASCNTSIVMRLTNPDDQTYVKRLVPDSLTGLMDILPSLRTGEALILGDAVAMPTRVAIDMPNPAPASGDLEFGRCWTKGVEDLDVDRVVRRWRARAKKL